MRSWFVYLFALGVVHVALAQHIPRPLIINVDHHGMPYQPTFDFHGNGPITYVWNTYRHDNETLWGTTFENGRRSRTQQMSAGEGIHYQPVVVATGERSGWLFWQTQISGEWRVVGRRQSEGFWKPIEAVSEKGRNALFPSAAVAGSNVAVVWEDHRADPQRIAVRVWNGQRWAEPVAVSQPDRPSYRPTLAAGPGGELWAFWDSYEGLDYTVYGRQLLPRQGPIERVSPPGKSCLKATAVHGASTGLVVAWIAWIDVIGGEGVLDQWNTIQAAVRRADRWEPTRDRGSPDIADLRHGMLNRIEPEAGPIWGYAGRRRHPMLVEDDGEVWLLWERKVAHEGRSTDPGELSGRRFDGKQWDDPVTLHQGMVRYEAPSKRRARNGQLTMVGMDPRHNYYTFVVELRTDDPPASTDLTGWKPVRLPLHPDEERPSIEIDGVTHHLYWGDLHVHTVLTEDAEGEVDELMHFARDKARIDVVVMQENDATSWLDINAQGAYRGGTLTEAVYRLSVYLSRRYTEPGRFIALPGWEWSDRTDDHRPNHRTVIFAGEETPLLRHSEHDDFTRLCDQVEAAGGLMNTQHPSFRLVDRRCDTNIEVAAGWGVYINRPEKIHADLSAGFKVGFVATSDGHRRNPGTGGGLTGIYAPELTPQAILQGIKDHKVFATNGSRVFVDARANGVFMGQDVRSDGAVELQLKVRAPKAIVRAVLIRDGDEILVVPGGGRTQIDKRYVDRPAEGFHWYYWRIEQDGVSPDYPGNMKVAAGHLAWSSPHRVTVER